MRSAPPPYVGGPCCWGGQTPPPIGSWILLVPVVLLRCRNYVLGGADPPLRRYVAASCSKLHLHRALARPHRNSEKKQRAAWSRQKG